MWKLISTLVVACTAGALLVLAVTGVMRDGAVGSAVRSFLRPESASENPAEPDRQSRVSDFNLDETSLFHWTGEPPISGDSLTCEHVLPIADVPVWWGPDAPVSLDKRLASSNDEMPGTLVDWGSVEEATEASMDGRVLLRIVARMLESTEYLEE